MTSVTRALSALAISMTLLAPASGLAQETEEGTAPLDDGSLTSFLTTTSGLVALTGGASTGVMATMVAYTPDPKGRLVMAIYLRRNRASAAVACASGSGHVVDDLARSLGLGRDQRASLGRIMRDHRASLLPILTADRISPDDAGRFVRTLLDAMREDDALAGAVDAIEARRI